MSSERKVFLRLKKLGLTNPVRLMAYALSLSLFTNALLTAVLYWKKLDEQSEDKFFAQETVSAAIQGANEFGHTLLPDIDFDELLDDEVDVADTDEDKEFDETYVKEISKTIPIPKLDSLDRGYVLKDKGNRIDDNFAIPKGMYWRVAFWYDIYTKYDSTKRVIHHTRFPWIVFRVVDISPFLKGKGRYWTKVHRGERHVNKIRSRIRAHLVALSKMKSYKGLKGSKRYYYNILKKIPGKRQDVFRFAARSLRAQTGQKDHYQLGLKRSARYFPTMERIFKDAGLPVELTRLPLTESSFNLYATSKVGASGIWQFMPGVGSRLMKINKYIDERRSPLKSTVAATRLLKENYQILWRRWPLAVTAYNHGPGGVKRATRKARSRELGKIVERFRSKRFSFASANFYASFLAALHAENYKEHIYDNLEVFPAVDPQKVTLQQKIRVSKLISRIGVTKDVFYLYNPDLKKAINKNIRLPKGITIFTPQKLNLDSSELTGLIKTDKKSS